MPSFSPLDDLAEKAGILSEYQSGFGANLETVSTSHASKTAVLRSMGFDVSNYDAIVKSLEDFEEKEWSRLSETVVTCRIDKQPLHFKIRVPKSFSNEMITFKVKEENGLDHSFDIKVQDLPVVEEKNVKNVDYSCRLFRLDAGLGEGYHQATVKCGDREAVTKIIIAPTKCFMPEAISDGKRTWGSPIQLYAVRSKRNWGIGDFTDLSNVVEKFSALGMDIVGLNPLNVLFDANPEDASPYYSCSRLFLNWLYIDVESVDDFEKCAPAKELFNSAEFQKKLKEVKDSLTVKYTLIAELKGKVLTKLYDCFMSNEKDTTRAQAFRYFCDNRGEDLENLAIYQALGEKFRSEGNYSGSQDWEDKYKTPYTDAVKTFAKENRYRVNYFKYLQWLADTQLSNAGLACWHHRLGIGLYQDVAVGVAENSAETWSNPNLFVKNVTIGAPPDRFNPAGQKWGLAAASPIAMKDNCYEQFIKILRYNMGQAGAVRIDHFMQFERLYWIPNGDVGCYVSYPVDDLLNIVALESKRKCCAVIGEDLGTVPQGTKEKMEDYDILCMRMFFGQKNHDETFKRPEWYEQMAITGAGTHDMPTFAGWWKALDLKLSRKHGMISTDEAYNNDANYRLWERKRVLWILSDTGIRPYNQADEASLDGSYIPDLLIPHLHQFLSRSSSKIFLPQMEDIFQQEDQMNLPGTNTEYPNWRFKWPEYLEDILDIDLVKFNAKIINQERKKI